MNQELSNTITSSFLSVVGLEDSEERREWSSFGERIPMGERNELEVDMRRTGVVVIGLESREVRRGLRNMTRWWKRGGKESNREVG